MSVSSNLQTTKVSKLNVIIKNQSKTSNVPNPLATSLSHRHTPKAFASIHVIYTSFFNSIVRYCASSPSNNTHEFLKTENGKSSFCDGRILLYK